MAAFSHLIYLLSLADVGYLPPESSRLDKCEDMTLNLILKLNVSYDFEILFPPLLAIQTAVFLCVQCVFPTSLSVFMTC